MHARALEGLIDDAEVVCEIGVRLGKLSGEALLVAIEEARAALAAGGSTVRQAVDLQIAVSAAIVRLAPITLADIRSGWRPFQDERRQNVGKVAFAIFSFVLLFITAYMTQAYHRATLLYQTTLQLEDSRGAEQAIRLFGLLKKNQKDVLDSLTNGDKDFLYESFNKSLNDLTEMNVKALAYIPMATASLCELDFSGRLKHALRSAVHGTQKPGTADALQCYSSDDGAYQVPADLQPSLARTVALAANGAAVPGAGGAGGEPQTLGQTPQIQFILGSYFANLRDFMSAINVGFDPVNPVDYSYFKFRFEQVLSLLGYWVLPGLYGMLGAIIFLMRRILDPSLPSPTWLRFPFRIIMGGFAGIIIAWFWSPSAPQPSLPAFSSLGTFGLAFMIGYSTDFFFIALDKLVAYLSQLVQKPAAP